MPLVSVIVPVRDGEATLGRALDGLRAQRGFDDFEVIVVDNGSRDRSREIAEASSVVARVVGLERGHGPGAARNAGAECARGEILAFLDSDCEPSPGWLREGLRACRNHDLVQGTVVPDPQARRGAFDRTLWVTHAYGLFETANLFVTRELFRRLGGFPAGLEDRSAAGAAGSPFGEDVMFGWAAVRAGARTHFQSEALVRHAVFPRRASDYVQERRRLGLFPPLVARVPELREAFLYRRVFLNRRTAAFDLSVVGALGCVLSRRRWPLALLTPYCGAIARSVRRRGISVTGVEIVADLVGGIALARGSLSSRSLVL